METIGFTRSAVRAASAAAGIALALGLAAPAAANAQELGSLTPMSVDLPGYLVPGPGNLLAVGGSPTGLCQGAAAARVTDSGYPASAAVSWGVAMPGVGPCDLVATLDWHNLDTGARGQKTLDIPGPRLWTGVAHPYDAIIPTGGGTVEYRLTTNGGAAAGPIVVETSPWP
ncbi:hypothetical protein FQ137_08395 [Dietzia sp. ANT_WB102]|nr:hypothetical protein FQ137_08395 [Dietzia sp. ANT_WB102]